MKQLSPPQRVKWRGYLGRDIFTSDNRRLGAVSEILSDTWTGETFVRIRTDPPYGRSLCLPVNSIGLVTQQRLILDVTLDKIPQIEAHRHDYGSMRVAWTPG